MTTDEFFAEAKRLNLRVLGTPEETRAALDLKDAEIARLTAALEKLQQWADAYPVEVFPEVLGQEWQQANEVLAQAGLSMTRMNASNVRHVINGVRKLTAEGLGA